MLPDVVFLVNKDSQKSSNSYQEG